MKTLAMVLLCGLCVVIGGCATSTAPDDIGNPFLNDQLTFVQPGGYISSDDTVNTRAIVWLEEDYEQMMDPITRAELPAVSYQGARASFHYMIPSSEPLVDIAANDSVINHANNWRIGGANGSKVQTHFGQGATSNTLRKVADSYLGALDTSVTFGEHIRFTNLAFDATIDLSTDKSFTYSGPGGNMELYLVANSNVSGEHFPSAVSKRFYGVKGGTVKLTSKDMSSQDMNEVFNSDGYVEIRRWDMRFLPTSNGTKIAYIAVTSHKLPVKFVRSIE